MYVGFQAEIGHSDLHLSIYQVYVIRSILIVLYDVITVMAQTQ
jgi:hypothetical protein